MRERTEHLLGKQYRLERVTPSEIRPVLKFMAPFVEDGALVAVTPVEVFDNMTNFLMVREGVNIIGCGQLSVYRKDLAEIRSVAVKPDKQRQGLGTLIFDALEERAKEQGITHLVVITQAREFWRQMGFNDQDEGKHVLLRRVEQ